MHRSRAPRVGFPEREYSKPLCSPGPSWAKVLESTIGCITAPEEGSGCCPAWMAKVSSVVVPKWGFEPAIPFLSTRARSCVRARALRADGTRGQVQEHRPGHAAPLPGDRGVRRGATAGDRASR